MLPPSRRARVKVYLQYEDFLPREVTEMTYEQWRSGWVIPRKSVLELGAVPESCGDGLVPPQLWLRLQGWRLVWWARRTFALRAHDPVSQVLFSIGMGLVLVALLGWGWLVAASGW